VSAFPLALSASLREIQYPLSPSSDLCVSAFLRALILSCSRGWRASRLERNRCAVHTLPECV